MRRERRGWQREGMHRRGSSGKREELFAQTTFASHVPDLPKSRSMQETLFSPQLDNDLDEGT
jgi:hypothetical protein